MVIVALLLAAAWGLTPDRAVPRSTMTGMARVVDGDTLWLGDSKVRLRGLDAPELRQSCGAGAAAWPCGVAARRRLAELVADEPLQCVSAEHDRYGRLLGSCSLGSRDPGQEMVAEGLAVADGRYAGEEQAARQARRGIWAGPFVRPAEWRQAGGDEPEVLPPSRLASFLNWVGNMFLR
jgi:endonuclease YncB( thermonuclease family)